MKYRQITGFFAILIMGTVLMSGCTNTMGSPVATGAPHSVLQTTGVTPQPTTPVPSAIPPTGVWLRVTYFGNNTGTNSLPGYYAGTYGLPGYQIPVKDTGDHFYQIATVDGPVEAFIGKMDGSGDPLVIAVYKDGSLIKEESTTIPFRSIEFTAVFPTPTPVSPLPVTIPSTIPNLTGTWNVNANGAVLQKSGVPGEWTHHSGQYSTLSAQAVVTEQKERVFHGVFKAPQGKEESFIGVIGMDNKSFYYADQDGTNDGQIISNGLITMVYRQVTANDTVVAVGTWTRV